jgi:hypothetical protein
MDNLFWYPVVAFPVATYVMAKPQPRKIALAVAPVALLGYKAYKDFKK